MTSYSGHAVIAGDDIRLDVYGEVQDAGRVVAFFTAEQAFALSKDLGRLALRLRKPPSPEDFV